MRTRRGGQRGLLEQAENHAGGIRAALPWYFEPTGSPELTPPRLRGFLAYGVTADKLRARLHTAGIRAWVGHNAAGGTLIRFSPHVYTTSWDIDLLAETLRGV